MTFEYILILTTFPEETHFEAWSQKSVVPTLKIQSFGLVCVYVKGTFNLPYSIQLDVTLVLRSNLHLLRQT